MNIPNFRLPATPVTEMFFDHVTEIVHCKHELAEPFGRGPFDDVLQHWLASHRQEGLRTILCVRQQPRSLTASHDDHLVRTLRWSEKVFKNVQTNHVAMLID